MPYNVGDIVKVVGCWEFNHDLPEDSIGRIVNYTKESCIGDRICDYQEYQVEVEDGYRQWVTYDDIELFGDNWI